MERPGVGVGVCVRKEGKILLLRRINAHGHGTWCFPGGHLEMGESVEEAARRETREEAGVEIDNILLGPYTNDLFEEGKQYITLFAIADWKAGEPRICEPEKMTEIGWYSWDALPEPRFLPLKNLLASGFDPFA